MRKQQNKLVEEKLKILNILKDNRLCEGILLELIDGPDTSGLAQAELEQFNNKRCKSFRSKSFVSRHDGPPLLQCVALLSYRSSQIVKGFHSCEKVYWIVA
jgi:hypothetical protein